MDGRARDDSIGSEHVQRFEEMRRAQCDLVGKEIVGRSRFRWKIYIKIDYKERARSVCSGLNWLKVR